MVRYFVAKVASIADLKTCSETSEWACRDRKTPPHPADVLNTAFTSGPVILIFSVNNCHGWHGYAEMLSAPALNKDKVKESQNEAIFEWKYFKIRWKFIYIKEFGERCLASSQTENLTDMTGSPINNARNWQELPVDSGDRLCHLIEEYYNDLCAKRDTKEREMLEKAPKPFYSTDLQSSDSIWTEIVDKVEQELGKVILACPFGSQRHRFDHLEMDSSIQTVLMFSLNQHCRREKKLSYVNSFLNKTWF